MSSKLSSSNSTRSLHAEKDLINKRLLTVDVVEARNLKASSKSNLSDPFAAVYLRDLGGRESKPKYNTKLKSNTLAPKWNETFIFGDSYDLDSEENLPTLVVTIYHKGTYSVSEVFLGQVEIDLKDITTTSRDMWYSLEPDAKHLDVTGEVRLSLRFNRDLAPPESFEEEEEEVFDTTPLVNSDDVEEDNDDSPNCLEISLIQARNLLVMDKNIFGKPTSSDPIVRFEVAGRKSQESTCKKKNTNPIWNEKFVFSPVVDNSLAVTMIMEDVNNLTTRDFMGKAVIPLNDLIGKKNVKKTIKLLSSSTQADGIDRGEVDLILNWKHDRDVGLKLDAKQAKKDASISKKITGFAKSAAATIGVISNDDSDGEGNEPGAGDGDVEEKKPETEEEKVRI